MGLEAYSKQGFIRDFSVGGGGGGGGGEMMCIKPRLPGGVGVCSPRKFTCSEVASGDPKNEGKKLATNKLRSI